MDFRFEGGNVCSSDDRTVIASVEYILRKKGESMWRVYIKGVPSKRNFTRGEVLIYNTKGTENQNADNYLTVSEVGGPGYYICAGPETLNI